MTVYHPSLQAFKELNELSFKLGRSIDRRDAFGRGLVEIGQVLGEAWPEHAGFATLQSLAESFLEEQEQRAQQHREIALHIKTVDAQIHSEETAIERLNKELQDIQDEWQGLKVQCPSLPKRLEEARLHLEVVDSLMDRVKDINRTQAALDRSAVVIQEFEETVQSLAFRIGPPLTEFPSAFSWVRAARERLNAAKEVEQRHQQLADMLAENEEKLSEIEAELKLVQAGIDEECRSHQCPDRNNLVELLETSRRYRNLQDESQKHAEILRSVGDGLSMSELEAQTARWSSDVGLDGLESRVALLKIEIADTQQQCDTKREELAGQRTDFSRWDGSAADAAVLAEDADAYMTEVDRAWNEYLRVELARRVLTRAIEEFREKNQSKVLERAAEIFRRLTLGRYQNIDVEYEDGSPYLQLRLKDKSERRVKQLSDGTRDQLFLSLRLAFVASHNDQSEPLPLMMDDILVHFDDQRTEAALEVLQELARNTQILYFTHHDAVVDAASRVSRQVVSVHHMGDLVRH